MKAHLYNPLAAAFSHTFKLCVDKKVHVQVIAHGWDKATCKVVGNCDGTCCPQVELGEDAINIVDKFLTSDCKEGNELAGEYRNMIKSP